MPLTIYDTYAKAERRFAPADPNRVSLYVCGPTVYNYAHVGNARPVVVFDVLFRVLRQLYGPDHVVYVRNITDVDDKINQRAAELGVPISDITDKFAAVYADDMAALGALPPTLAPRATAHVPDIIDMIARLVENGFAYAADGHVLFDTPMFSDYGRLSGRSLNEMIAGARVEVAAYKRNPADFVLWKPSKPGEPEWASPFGPGRPGWHIECSAMIEATLGLPIDIHGGGHDLIFPHHENEIAQGRCADQRATYAHYWMHNGFLTLNAEKMSKSVGNGLLVHDLLTHMPGEVVRWALLSAHYRAPLDWTEDLLAQSRRSLDRLYGVLERAGSVIAERTASVETILDPLLDDLNTPEAISALFKLAGDLDRAVAEQAPVAGGLKHQFATLAEVLGVLQIDPGAWFKGGTDDQLTARIDQLIAQRGEARRAKDWTAADRIRGELTELGVVVLDVPGGAATWRLKEG